jgi:hypothetical protein
MEVNGRLQAQLPDERHPLPVRTEQDAGLELWPIWTHWRTDKSIAPTEARTMIPPSPSQLYCPCAHAQGYISAVCVT